MSSQINKKNTLNKNKREVTYNSDSDDEMLMRKMKWNVINKKKKLDKVKNLVDFPDAVKYYKYWIQATVYKKMAYVKFIKDLPDAEDWDIVVTFIVIDKYNQVYPFQVSKESLEIWGFDFENIEDTISYHYLNKDYTLPYELAIGNVKL